MANLQVFEHPMFGEVRMIISHGNLRFVGIDITKALEYANPSKAVIDHCKGISKMGIPSQGGIQETNTITQGDVYRLIVKAADQSKNLEIKEKAEKFESWIFDEIVPSVVDQGAYITNRANPEMLRKKADEIESIAALNEAAKIILPVLEEAGLKPQYRAIALRQLYRKSGVDLPIEEMKAMRELFDLTSIANNVGIYSKSEKPHGQAVGAIIRQLDIQDEEKEIVTFEKNGHSGTAIQYTSSVVEKVRKWLKEANYPNQIAFIDSTGKEKKYTAVYKLLS